MVGGGDSSLSLKARRNAVVWVRGTVAIFVVSILTCEAPTSTRCFTLTGESISSDERSYAQVVAKPKKWRKVIVTKYEIQRRGWCLEETKGSYAVGLWWNVRNGWGNFSNYVSYKVGNGSHICFLQIFWCSEAALRLSFP